MALLLPALLLPGTLHANVITAATLTGTYLVFGNLLIGVIEGIIVADVCKVSRRRAILIMIVANYFSAWIGFFAVAEVSNLLNNLSIYYIRTGIFLSFLFFFILTYILELPFIIFLLRKQKNRLKRSLLINLLVQAVTYVIIGCFSLIFPAINLSLFWNADIDSRLDYIRNPEAEVYYISNADHFVYKSKLGRWKPELVYGKKQLKGYDCLYTEESEDGGQWDLYAFVNVKCEPPSYEFAGERILLKKNFSKKANHELIPDARTVAYKPVDLRPKNQREWVVDCPPIRGRGLRFCKGNFLSDTRISLFLDTPFVYYVASQATLLPDDEVIFQLQKQICVFERKTGKLGMLAEGRSPIVKLPEAPQKNKIIPLCNQ